ncbi:HNH endonuclease [Methylocapsa polymorpha]|uniref:HNH endonuclease n=1 Tax=Methylocapsa polymorpha TaxID=3080828 RepID=A0ABZ0HWE3_9HYPH|nr:HNH endonuclease [Methylocapsa sp. RX1]
MKSQVIERFKREFGEPARDLTKIKAWDVRSDLGVVVQTDQPNKENAAFVWLPYPREGQTIPEIALEYPGESGRHSNTYASPGLRRGEPALKLTIRDPRELEDTIEYIHAMSAATPLPEVKARQKSELNEYHELGAPFPTPIDLNSMPKIKEVKPRREAIPRVVQREVWQRDGGRCVECSTREKLCFDHIVPFSRGGSNTVRNIQLLCETCNLTKGNRI